MFEDRQEAGIRLSLRLAKNEMDQAIVVAIPRGGVVVGKVVSDILQIPLSALVVKKIGAPSNPELAIGAVGAGETVYWDEDIVERLKISEEQKTDLLKKTAKIVQEKVESLGVGPPEVKGKTAIIVDDGVATGATSVAASLILREMGASKVILATPVISKYTKREVSSYFDKIICGFTPLDFQAVGQFYREFPQVGDEEVKKLLSSKH